jgi:enoyl-CoA hydratase/carnithine racemase
VTQQIRLETADGIATLRFDSPPVNAIDLPFTDELAGTLDALSGRTDLAGVVLTGAGPAFCAGINFKVVPTYDAARKRAMVGNINRMACRLYGLPYPVVAAVDGPAIGGGMVLALACDFRLAGNGARFALGEVTAGIPFPAVPLISLEDVLDAPTRRELALTGRAVDADEAQRLRLVDRPVAPGDLLAQARDMVRRLAAAPGYARVKAQIRAPALQRMHAVIASGDDPMLAQWV